MTSELYEDESSHMENQIQGFESNTNEVFNFSTGMDMIGFGKNIQQQQNESWKCLFGKTSSQLPGPSSSSSRIMSTSWHQSGFIDDETNHFTRPSQGLSLSLSSNLYLQGQVNHQSQDHQDMRFVTLNNRAAGLAYDQHVDGLSGKSTSYHQGEFQLKNSRYLAPAQELLVELCSLGSKQNEKKKKKANKSFKQWEVQEQDTISILRKQSLYSLDFMELHKKKLKLLSMLEEVDRRYKHYLDQLKSMVSTFEDVAGSRSADEYTTLALTAMSKHFRCLRDAIVTQIQETKKAMGDKNQDVPGTSRGETPRLRALDQSFRRQKALQQLGMMENHPWRPQRGLPENSVSILRAWLFEHFLHPYPTDVDKHILSRQTGLSRSQVSNWFINARVRLWKPMVEEMYLEELKEQENTTSPEDINGQPSQDHHEDQKPTHEQLATIDSTCLPPNITTSQLQRTEDHENIDNMHHQHYGRIDENFGAIDLDFSSYNHNSAGSVSYNNHNFSSPASVSLTLGLQQHGGSLAFSSCTAPDQNTLFYSRHPMEDSQEVQYSLIDGETQNLPHRDLMGAQLLHDLAG